MASNDVPRSDRPPAQPEAQPVADPLTVVSLQVDSFKRLRAAALSPSSRGLVLVRGRNGQGKSAVLESMLAALGGGKVGSEGRRASGELPITEGAHGAEVVVHLGDLVVRRRWTRDSGGAAKTALTVESVDGTQHRSPQAVLDALTGRFADPVAFLEQSPDDQVRTVLGVLGLDEELARLEQEAQGHYDRRRDLGRDADRLGKVAEELAGDLAAAPPPVVAGTVDELAAELQRAKDHNAGLEALAASRAECERRGKDLAKRIEGLKAELERVQQEREQALQTWQELRQREKDSPPPVDVQPILDALSAHEAASEDRARREIHARAEREAEAARQAHAQAEADLAAARAAVSSLLAGASFPIEGMAYDPEARRLTVGGIPFAQASQAERLKAAAAVAMAGDPRVRVLFAREGSLLDDESRAQLAAIAEAAGWQLWLEVVDSTREGVGVWVEDGEAVMAEATSGEE